MNAMPALAASLSTASLDYAAFKTAILNACKIVEKNNTILILDTVLIKAAHGGVLVTGTDLDIYTTTFVPGRVDEAFECLIDCHKLKSTMDKVKDAGTIDFTLGDDRLTTSIGKLNLALNQELEIADFPSEAGFRDKLDGAACSFVLQSSALAKALSKIAFAISQEETRYYLNGVFMHLDRYREKLVLVATDGHRLARYDLPVPPGAWEMDDAGAIIPEKTVMELIRLLKRKGCPAEVRVTVAGLGASFRLGEHEHLESKLIDGSFPDYLRIVPTQNDRGVIAYVSDMTDAIKQASSISAERSRAIKLAVSPGEIQFSCTHPEFGTASTSINANTDAEIEIGFNAGYLLEMLGHIGGAAVLKMSDPGSPAIILDTSDPDLTYVQMPRRV